MKIPAVFLSKDYMKKLARQRIQQALKSIEENLEVADLPERTVFEVRVVASYVKEDLSVSPSIIQPQRPEQSLPQT